MRSRTRQSLITAVLATIGVGAGVWWFGAHIQSVGLALEEQLLAIQTQVSQQSALLRLQAAAEGSAVDRASLTDFFLGEPSDVIAYNNLIKSTAPKVGVSLEVQELAEIFPDGSDTAEWVSVRLSSSGSRTGLENFLAILESTPYHSRIISVNLSEMVGGVWEAEIEVWVGLDTTS
jgi:hypothetical protein